MLPRESSASQRSKIVRLQKKTKNKRSTSQIKVDFYVLPEVKKIIYQKGGGISVEKIKLCHIKLFG